MKKPVIIVGALVLIAIILIAFSRYSAPTVASSWEDTGVACLANGHENLAQHIHPILAITVDGVSEAVPATIGLRSDCMAEVHAHDGTGKIHIESADAGKKFSLQDFFSVWGKTLAREGYTVEVTSDGALVEAPLTLELFDHQQIEIRYMSVAQ